MKDIFETKLWLYYENYLQASLTKIADWSWTPKRPRAAIRNTQLYQLHLQVRDLAKELNDKFSQIKRDA